MMIENLETMELIEKIAKEVLGMESEIEVQTIVNTFAYGILGAS